MNGLTLFNEIFDIAYLLAFLTFVILIWRSLERRAKQAETLQHTIIEIGAMDAESARQAVETTRMLAAIIQNEQAKSGPAQ